MLELSTPALGTGVKYIAFIFLASNSLEKKHISVIKCVQASIQAGWSCNLKLFSTYGCCNFTCKAKKYYASVLIWFEFLKHRQKKLTKSDLLKSENTAPPSTPSVELIKDQALDNCTLEYSAVLLSYCKGFGHNFSMKTWPLWVLYETLEGDE